MSSSTFVPLAKIICERSFLGTLAVCFAACVGPVAWSGKASGQTYDANRNSSSAVIYPVETDEQRAVGYRLRDDNKTSKRGGQTPIFFGDCANWRQTPDVLFSSLSDSEAIQETGRESTNQPQFQQRAEDQANQTAPSQTAEPQTQQQGQPDKKAEEAAKAKKEKAEKLKTAFATAYKPLYFDNDFSYLCDPNFNQCWLGDRLKRIGIGWQGWLDIGGEYRFRLHNERNIRGAGLTGVDDDFGLHRTRIFANAKFGSSVRVYAEFIDAESNWEDFAPRAIEVNRTDFQNLFAEALLWENGTNKISARVGRQELLFGDQRLVSPLDWANTRRTFEGVDLIWKYCDWKVDAFWTNPVTVNDHSFDSPDQNQEFMGIYSTYSGVKDLPLDLYFLRQLNGAPGNSFEYNTVGTRQTGRLVSWQTLVETAYQFGENNDGSDHSAGMATLGFGRKLSATKTQPTLWFYYDYASGDSDRGAGHGFHHHFPLGHKYLGFMDLFGRRNIEDFNCTFSWKPAAKLQMQCWYHYFTLATPNDTPYSVTMTSFNPANNPGSVRLGQEIDLLGTWTFHPRQDLTVGYSHFFDGAYYSTTAGVPFVGDADFFYTQYAIRF